MTKAKREKAEKKKKKIEKSKRPAVNQAPSLKKDLLNLIGKLVGIVAVFLLIFTFIFGFHENREPTMSPAVKDGDLVLIYRLNKKYYQPKDLVAVTFKGEKQVRRVIATAGDVVDITEDGLLINEALQQEPEIYEETKRYADQVNFPLTVPEGAVFLLGDARRNATDSRVYGCVKVKDTLGKVMTVMRRRNF